MMTDVATVSSQVTARHSAGAKGAGASAGTGTLAEGAFAALLGEAGQMPADGDAAMAGKAGQTATDPALLASEGSLLAAGGDGVTSEIGETPLLTGDIDPATGKPRKGAPRGKDAAKGDDVLLQAQAAIFGVPAQNVAGERSEASAKAGADGVAIGADATKGNSAAALAVNAQTAGNVPTLATKDGKGDKSANAAPASGNVAIVQGAAVTQTASNASGQPGDQPTEGDGKDSRSRTETQTVAVGDDPAAADTVDPLRDIVQSLPPVVQSQLGSAGVGRVASTGEVLGDHVIDMGVSGQWIDRMAREIATVADGSGHARFQLNPPSLGRIQVDLWRGDDQMNLRLLAETDEAARRLREGQAALESHARVASLSFSSVSVEKSSAPFDSGDKQNQRQGAEQNGTMNQQSFAQAQGQSAQGRNNNSSGNLNRSGAAAVIGSERQAELEQDARTIRAGDPRVRFA